jgi:hypothetical protein
MARLVRSCLLLLATGGAILTSACASLTSGTNQSIKFETDPSEAECTLTQSNTQLAKVKTPGSVLVKRTNSPIAVACTKDGYYETRAVISTTTSAGAWGNLIVGGIVGVVIDTQTGAAYRYYDPPKFTMIAAADTPPAVSQTVSPGITVLPPEGPPSGRTAAAAAPSPAASRRQTATPAAPAIASTNGEASKGQAETAVPATSAIPSARLDAESWKCGINNIGNISNPHFTLDFVVAADRTISVVNYANAPATIVRDDPLTFTAINPRGSRLTTFTLKPDNSMNITGPALNKPGASFYNEGTCSKA